MSGFLLFFLLFAEAKTTKAQQETEVRIPYGRSETTHIQ